MKKFLGTIFAGFAVLVAVPAFGARPISAQPQVMVATQRAPFLTVPNLPGGGGAGTQGNVSTNQPPPAAFTVQDCMNQLSACVEGSLSGGIAAMFELSMRTAILSGMDLCGEIVERCVISATVLNINAQGNQTNVRAYAQTGRSGVWHDFNSRVVQPAYFNMVMRNNGGLTPNQAERVCLLIDRNVHGDSFAAVGGGTGGGSFAWNNVTGEFGQPIGQFNEQGGTRPTPDPLGRQGIGIDHQRGHYGRWNAREGTCSVRVAAYRSGNLITLNQLLGMGGQGDAETWINAGESFSCTGNLFDGRILNQTATAALIGVGGGTVLGAGIGAGIGGAGVGNVLLGATAGAAAGGIIGGVIDSREDDNNFFGTGMVTGVVVGAGVGTIAGATVGIIRAYRDNQSCEDPQFQRDLQTALNNVADRGFAETNAPATVADEWATLRGIAVPDAAAAADRRILIGTGTRGLQNCHRVMNTLAEGNLGGAEQLIERELMAVRGDPRAAGNRALAHTVGGAAIGAAAGGIATAITTFIERNNVECRIGDGLDSVGYGRSGRVPTLREFYVDWALNLPETLIVNTVVQGANDDERCVAWNAACNSVITSGDCNNVAILLQSLTSLSRTQVNTACFWTSGQCRPRLAISQAQGGICPCPAGQSVNANNICE